MVDKHELYLKETLYLAQRKFLDINEDLFRACLVDNKIDFQFLQVEHKIAYDNFFNAYKTLYNYRKAKLRGYKI